VEKSGIVLERQNRAPFKTSLLFEDGVLPLVVEPGAEDIDLPVWLEQHREIVDAWLYKHGVVLFRGFNKDNDIETFETFTQSVSRELLEYRERSSPRTALGHKIYTSTEYPSTQTIFLHNENSYQGAWPMRLFFYSHKTAEIGGETPFADCRRIFDRIRPEVRRTFAEKGIMYVRNFNRWSSVPWQEVFGTDDRAVAEAHCRKSGLKPEWREKDTLRTTVVRNLVTEHPVTGESTWFNHGTFFHISTLPPAVREVMNEYGEENLPSNSYYGDGSPIEADVLQHLRQIYLDEKRVFSWQDGDMLIADNMLAAHGREPYAGDRKIMLAMADPMAHPNP